MQQSLDLEIIGGSHEHEEGGAADIHGSGWDPGRLDIPCTAKIALARALGKKRGCFCGFRMSEEAMAV
jgi:hypothetical protein